MEPDRFTQSVLSTVDRWRMLAPGTRVGIAVSGGADSVALLCAMHNLAPSRTWALSVLHVNHRLRGAESDADARFVAALAAELGLFLQIADLPLTHNGNLEQEARELRYAWFRDLMHGCTTCTNLGNVALGHTRSDQAETVLFRFLRGSGSAGLAGIRPVTTDGFVRPLFEMSREAPRAYLHSLAQPWREDLSNQDPAFDRNRIRLDLMPHLAQQWNPRIENTLSSFGEWARAEEEYWDEVTRQLAQVHFTPSRNGAQICTTAALLALPLASARRLIRHVIRQIRNDLRGIDFAHTEQILSLVRAGTAGSGRVQIPGVDVIRSFDWVRFAKIGSYGGERHFSCPAKVPGQFPLPESDSFLLLRVENGDCLYNESVQCLDRDRIPGPMDLRTWRPGDRFRPAGHASDVKLKDLFQQARIPIWDRRTWPVLAVGETVVWSRLFGAAAPFAADASSSGVITVREVAPNFAEHKSVNSENGNQEPDVLRL